MTSTPNVELLRETMDHILAHPHLHDQRNWATRTICGTAACFAGLACVLSGVALNQDDLDHEGVTDHTADGHLIGATARRLLGLDMDTAAVLFWGFNEPEDLKHYVDQIADCGVIADAAAIRHYHESGS